MTQVPLQLHSKSITMKEFPRWNPRVQEKSTLNPSSSAANPQPSCHLFDVFRFILSDTSLKRQFYSLLILAPDISSWVDIMLVSAPYCNHSQSVFQGNV